jgi:hypothetical protein
MTFNTCRFMICLSYNNNIQYKTHLALPVVTNKLSETKRSDGINTAHQRHQILLLISAKGRGCSGSSFSNHCSSKVLVCY